MPIMAGSELTSHLLLEGFRTDLLEKYAAVSSIGEAQSTTSLTFVNLATVGPQVTLRSRGTRAFAWISCRAWNTGGINNQCLMGVSVTDSNGDDVVAASTSAALIQAGLNAAPAPTQPTRQKGILIPFNIVPGTYTYTAQYRSSVVATSAFFDSRVLVVFAP